MFHDFIHRYIQVEDVIDGPQNLLEVNFTPQYLNDVLELRHTWLTASIIFGILFIILLLLFIALRQRVNIAIKMIEHGSKAVSNMLSSVVVPLIPFILHTAVILWFVFLGMYLASMGEKQYNVHYDQDQTGNEHSSTIWLEYYVLFLL